MIAEAKTFQRESRQTASDMDQREFIRGALKKYLVKRDEHRNRFADWQAARKAAAAIKKEAVDHLDHYLEEFIRHTEARGTRVHVAADGDSAVRYILDLARDRGVRSVVKSKAMTTEEIHLNRAFEAAGYKVVESDLGEYIVQLREEAPYHFVFPAMHLRRQDVSKLFVEKLGSRPTENPEELTLMAREIMRGKFCDADMGISGGNFLVADTGMISITENEGNARLTTALPRIHVAVVGIEKVVPRLADLPLLLPMLATAGAGQPMTCYNTFIGGPRQPDEPDGPEEFHVVLLDNHRTRLLADAEQRDALHCIRCGACLNVCPIFNNVGGHTYGTTYQGPIGSVITPHFRGLQNWKHLSSASSLCGACTEVCPVNIDIHHHLLHNRRNAVERGGWSMERLGFRMFSRLVRAQGDFPMLTAMARWLQPLYRPLEGTWLDPFRAWTGTRALPKLAPQSFKQWWKARRNG